MRKAFDLKRSGISILEVEAVPQSCIPLNPDWFEYCFIYEKFVACGKCLQSRCLTMKKYMFRPAFA
jgi:hypothetical protein